MVRRDDSESESAKVGFIVSRFFSKCMHVILESRYKCNNAVETDKWFNLLLRDLPPELNIRNTSCLCSSTQLVVDLVLLHHTRQNGNDGHLHSRPSCGGNWRWDGKEGKVIERWTMMFEVNKGRGNNADRFKGSSRSKTFYKKCVLMLRSLYSMIRLLPAYKLFRDLTSSRKPCEYSLGYHISSFTEPFTRVEETQMQKFLFDSVESSCGTLCLSVLYLSSLADLKIEPSYQMLPHLVLPDYCVGVSVDVVCAAPMLHGNGMVTYRSKPLLAAEIGMTAHTQLPTALLSDAATRETSGEELKTAWSAKRQWPTAQEAASTSPSCGRSHSLDCLRSEVSHCQNPIELGDPFQPRLSDNAALGSMFTIFNEAAPLRRSSGSAPNNTNLQATSLIVPANPTVKTKLDALLELQDHIELKKIILQRSPYPHHNS